MKITKTHFVRVAIGALLLTVVACGAEEDASGLDTAELGATAAFTGTQADVTSLADARPDQIANIDISRVTQTSPELEGLAKSGNSESLPEIGNYIFEQVSIAGAAGAQVYDSNEEGNTWIGALKLDSMYRYRIVAHYVTSEGTFDRSVVFEGLYQVRPGYIDFADERGRALFRMDYHMYRTGGTLYLNHDAEYGAAQDGDIVGLVARHL
jgi:hypothetical protein